MVRQVSSSKASIFQSVSHFFYSSSKCFLKEISKSIGWGEGGGAVEGVVFVSHCSVKTAVFTHKFLK